jgi:tetratricopeptide (TPR) repeat protein
MRACSRDYVTSQIFQFSASQLVTEAEIRCEKGQGDLNFGFGRKTNFGLFGGFACGLGDAEAFSLTKIDPWFLRNLREISPTPANLYNVACTWALLGEKDLALECLKRDLEENPMSTGARDKQALSEFADFTKYFPQDANAPEAQYYMGLIYDHGEQYDDAAQVFEAVAERYPDSPKAADAMYMKGVEYQKAKSDKKAVAAYRAFLTDVESASLPSSS